MRKQKRVVVFDKERFDGEWPPENVTECVAWFAAKVAEIPDEHKATARIGIDSVGSYEDSHYAKIEIYYNRPETDEEMNEREHAERRQQDAQTTQELRTLAALQAKYRRDA